MSSAGWCVLVGSCAWCIRATFRVDLYDPSRDEIRVGLFSRCVSPFVLLAGDDNLWLVTQQSANQLRSFSSSGI